MSKEIIAVDIDDVLAANAKGFVAFSNERWKTNLTVDDYQEHWAELWGIDFEETERRAQEFHISKVMGGYEHFQSAKPVLELIARDYELIVITSRRREVSEETREWIEAYFPGIFTGIHHAGFYENVTKESFNHTKADLAKVLNVSYLIDDQLKHCIAAAQVGIKAVLYGNYPWNRAESLPANVVCCHDWQDVRTYFLNEQ